jgi:hypothetical protein
LEKALQANNALGLWLVAPAASAVGRAHTQLNGVRPTPRLRSSTHQSVLRGLLDVWVLWLVAGSLCVGMIRLSALTTCCGHTRAVTCVGGCD